MPAGYMHQINHTPRQSSACYISETLHDFGGELTICALLTLDLACSPMTCVKHVPRTKHCIDPTLTTPPTALVSGRRRRPIYGIAFRSLQAAGDQVLVRLICVIQETSNLPNDGDSWAGWSTCHKAPSK